MSSEVRAAMFLAMATATASVAVVGLHGLLRSYDEAMQRAEAEPDTVPVWLANKDLYPGIAIDSNDLYAVHVPAPVIPEGAFLSPDSVIGRVPRERILANDVVRAQRLFDPESGDGLNAVIPRGMRAVSVNIEDGRALQGLLHPGSYVDVLFTSEGTKGEKAETVTMLQAMFVLAVDSRMSGETRDDAMSRGPQRPSVTLLVDPTQAEMIAHAKGSGALRLTLRHGDDVVPFEFEREVYEPKPTRPPQARPEPVSDCQVVERVEGDHKWTQRVHADGTPCDPG